MKHIGLILLAWFVINQAGQDIYVCKNVAVSLFSKAPMEDIDATTNKGSSVFNATTGEVAFSIPIRSFKFDKALMQEHFNENYMESEKFPDASFHGKIAEKIPIDKNGNYAVNATGLLTVHGVKQTRTIAGNIIVNNGAVTLNAEFIVTCKDHQIDIPTLVFQKIAEHIKIHVAAHYSPYK